MKLSEKYLVMVGRSLPKKVRSEILEELRANMADQLDGGVDEKEMLEAMGDPRAVARQYNPNLNYLIAPELREVYFRALGFTLMAVTIGLVVAQIVQIIFGGYTGIGMVFGLLGTLWMAWLSVFGSITLIFFLINRFAFDEIDLKQEPHTWSVSQLEKVDTRPGREKEMSDALGAFIFTVLAMLLLNGYLIHRQFTVIDMDLLRANAVWITLVWGIDILLLGFVLIRRQWSAWARILKVMTSAAGMIIIVRWINLPGFFTPDGLESIADVSSALVPMVRWLPRFIAVVAVLGLLTEAVRHGKAIWLRSR